MESDNFTVEYNYQDTNQIDFTSEERHIIWKYKYLKIALEKFSRKEKEIIKKYELANYSNDIKKDVCQISGNYIYSEIGYNMEKVKTQNIKSNRKKDKKIVKNKTKNNDEVYEIRSQILRF